MQTFPSKIRSQHKIMLFYKMFYMLPFMHLYFYVDSIHA